jgi:hypothetical protein
MLISDVEVHFVVLFGPGFQFEQFLEPRRVLVQVNQQNIRTWQLCYVHFFFNVSHNILVQPLVSNQLNQREKIRGLCIIVSVFIKAWNSHSFKKAEQKLVYARNTLKMAQRQSGIPAKFSHGVTEVSSNEQGALLFHQDWNQSGEAFKIFLLPKPLHSRDLTRPV